jgi:carboxylesterase type B
VTYRVASVIPRKQHCQFVMTHSMHHPLLGDICGTKLENENIVQYLGIQYATLKHRFSEPQVKLQYEGKIDATSFGYVTTFTVRDSDDLLAVLFL